VNGNCIEIETEIEEFDFSQLWMVADSKLKKVRYIVDEWEIDLGRGSVIRFKSASNFGDFE
jgi:hypothetical protein